MTRPVAEQMSGYVLTGHGGLDRLRWREDLPVPTPGPDQVLMRVLGSSVNNTDVNTRIGWYSPSVRSETHAGAIQGLGDHDDGGWPGGDLRFPRIQGADCAGEIVQVGARVDADRVGERVLVRTMQSAPDAGPWACRTLGSELDGGFAEYLVVDARHALTVRADLDPTVLGVVPCAYTTAENMVQRAGLSAEPVLVTGASGGVGLAAVQLAALRGAEVTAVAGPDKAQAVLAAGASRVIGRQDPIPQGQFAVVVDVVGGPRWTDLLAGLDVGGRLVSSGAIAGPIVELDLRTLYLRDLTLLGATYQPDHILPAVIEYLESGRLRPVVAATFPLSQMPRAQRMFLDKKHVGKIAITVPSRG
jgi:2-desacetyl-2-hydroxyethyl bacteriochlorophyllide A dehydrogenase